MLYTVLKISRNPTPREDIGEELRYGRYGNESTRGFYSIQSIWEWNVRIKMLSMKQNGEEKEVTLKAEGEDTRMQAMGKTRYNWL